MPAFATLLFWGLLISYYCCFLALRKACPVHERRKYHNLTLVAGLCALGISVYWMCAAFAQDQMGSMLLGLIYGALSSVHLHQWWNDDDFTKRRRRLRRRMSERVRAQLRLPQPAPT